MLDTVTALTVSLAAGICALLLVYNRFIVNIRDGRPKYCLTLGAFLFCTVTPIVFALMAGPTWWLAIPGAFLALIAVGEVRRLWIRYCCRAPQPMATENVSIALRKPVTTQDVAIHRYEVPLPQGRFERLRVAHLSDFHVSSLLPLDYYRAVFERAAASEPDLMFLTGDFISEARFSDKLRGIVEFASARCGVFAVLGNHDYWLGASEVASALEDAGIHVMGNRSVALEATAGANVTITGCEAPWGKHDWKKPLGTGEGVALALCHTPDNIYRLSRAGASAVFSGHYHAGQVRVPGLGSLVVPSIYGRRFDHGHFLVDGTHLFVTAGIGAVGVPFRLYCQPDLFIVDLLGRVACAERDALPTAHGVRRPKTAPIGTMPRGL